MNTERELDEILAEIARGQRAMNAPAHLERVLCAAAAGRKNPNAGPGLKFAWTRAAAFILLAAFATAGVLWQARRHHQPQSPQARSVPQVVHPPELSSLQVAARPGVASKSAPVLKAATSRASPRDSSPKPPTWNSLDEFVDLPMSEGLPAAAELSVVRIKLRGSDLQQYGLQAPPDAVAQTMLAEFAVGEDGLPRAIRIVR